MTRALYLIVCGAVLGFLLLPLILLVPLSFSSGEYLTISSGMLKLNANAFSIRWYHDFFTSADWHRAIVNSLIVGLCTTVLATTLGTIAAIGLTDRNLPFRSMILGVALAPMIVPVVVTAAGLYFAFSKVGLTQSLPGLVIAHTILAVPMVVMTVMATLSNFDRDLVRASQSLAAPPLTTFMRITLPLILPGVVSGAVFAFATSLDEVVTTIFLAGVDQRTIPLQMWGGIREELSPTILAAATMLTGISLLLLLTVQFLRARGARAKVPAV